MKTMKPVKTIAITNPRTIEVVSDAIRKGVGRNAVEAAQNLIERAYQALPADATATTQGPVRDRDEVGKDRPDHPASVGKSEPSAV